MRHFVHQAPDGRWHAVYKVAGCNQLTSMGDALTERAAQSLADELNADYAYRIKQTYRDFELRGISYVKYSADI